MRPTTGLVLASAASGRRWPLCGTPRALVPLANCPLVMHQVLGARAAGITRVAVAAPAALLQQLHGVLGDGSELQMRIDYLAVPDPPAPLDALLAANGLLEEGPLLVESAGTLVLEDLKEFLDAFDSGGLDALLVAGGVGKDGANARSDAGTNPSSGAGDLLILAPSAYGPIRELGLRGVGQPGLTDMLEAVSAAGARTASVARPSAALHIDTADDVLEGNRLALRRIQPGYADARIVDSRISGDVAIHESALLESTVVLGPVLIGPSARLYDSYVGPYTAIGRGASLEFVEIENSVVLEGAVVERTGPRLRESILGVNARVFGGSQVQSVRLLVGRDAEISLP